ncbi:MAG: DUF262 domain-containing protein [Pirellulaceae bacterium]|nr:DUF262 domain-containing protein [Pirellulaceae bacterium]
MEQLLQEAAGGRLRIPAFQRPLRWRAKNVIEFLDSIRRGFPVGELLFSRQSAKAATVHYGSFVVEAPEQHTALWVVDGQQRITALAATMLRPEPTPRGDRWAIWYDLEREEFAILKTKEAHPAWMPLNVLGDSVKQLKWIHAWPYANGHDELVNRAFEVGKAIREFELPAYIVEGIEQHVLRLIFTRVNTGGIEMRESEIFEALYGDEGDKPIRSAVSRLCELGFGQLDGNLFLRCCGTLYPALNKTIGTTAKLPSDAMRRTEAALRRTITAIKEAAGIPHWQLMPYRMPLIFLTAFYDRFPDEDPRIDRRLAHWIWRGALTGEHEDSSNARIQRLVKDMKHAKSANEFVDALLASVDPDATGAALRNNPADEIDREISLRRAASKVFILGLLAAEPRRPSRERQLELWDDDFLDGTFDEPDNDADQAANAPDSLNLSKVYFSLTDQQALGSAVVIRLPGVHKEEILAADADTLRSFLLDEQAVQRLAVGDVDGFLSRRRHILTEYFARFVADRWGDRVDTRPSIRSILEHAAT